MSLWNLKVLEWYGHFQNDNKCLWILWLNGICAWFSKLSWSGVCFVLTFFSLIIWWSLPIWFIIFFCQYCSFTALSIQCAALPLCCLPYANNIRRRSCWERYVLQYTLAHPLCFLLTFTPHSLSSYISSLPILQLSFHIVLLSSITPYFSITQYFFNVLVCILSNFLRFKQIS